MNRRLWPTLLWATSIRMQGNSTRQLLTRSEGWPSIRIRLRVLLQFGEQPSPLSGRPEEAIPLLHKALRLNPFAPTTCFVNLSVAYRMTGRFDEAVEQAKRAVERDPKDL